MPTRLFKKGRYNAIYFPCGNSFVHVSAHALVHRRAQLANFHCAIKKNDNLYKKDYKKKRFSFPDKSLVYNSPLRAETSFFVFIFVSGVSVLV